MTITAAKYGRPLMDETEPHNVIVTMDGVVKYVPIDIENRDYRKLQAWVAQGNTCLLYTSPSPRDKRQSRMPSSA